MADSNIEEICGLWERTSSNGREYIGGRVSDEDGDITIPAGSFVMVFPNDSDNPKAPAFRLTYAPPGPNYQKPAATTGAFNRFKAGGGQAADAPAAGGAAPAGGADLTDEDIPF